MTRRLTVLLFAVCAAWSYVPRDPAGLNLHRADFANIQYLVNQNIVAGLANADGRVWITGDSDPLNAIGAALATWSGVTTSAARFVAQRTTSALNNSNDRQHVVVFSDTPEIRSVLGSTVAITAIFYTVPDGAIIDTDIIFNPAYTFSTTFAEDTMDLQSVVTHELGHALGANHTNVLGAAMSQSALPNDNRQASLSSDDIAFVSSLYPAVGGNGYAAVIGRAALNGGQPLRGGLVTVVSPSTGVTVSGFTSLADGSFRFQAPPGEYLVYVEPLGGYVLPGNLYIPSNVAVDTNFQSFFLGGNFSPTLLTLSLGADVNLTLQAPAGLATSRTPFIGIGRAGGSEAATFYLGPFNVSSGQSADLLISGEGIDPLAEQNLTILGGGITVRPGTMRKTTSTVSGFPVYRVTLDIAPAALHRLGTIVLRKGSDTVTLTGAIAVGPPQIVNAGSFLGGAVSPGEVVSFFGSRVGPSTPVYGRFDATGALASALGDVSIVFDGIPAPLFYADQNQVNVQVPYEVAARQFTTMTAVYGGQPRGVFTIPVRASHPGICVVTNADGSLTGPQSPAPVGGIVVIWGTGAGVTSIPARTGTPSPANSTVQAIVNIGGIATTPLYAGLTPGGVGLIQVNVAIPAGAPSGNSVPLKVQIGDTETQTVYISIR
jgi:uncharacterized protein (TIGR03437 family)